MKLKQPVSQLEKQAKWPDNIAELYQIPWGHNIAIMQKCDTIENNWSRSVLTHQTESDLFARQGKAITNFKKTLPTPQSDLAREIIKDPYNFVFSHPYRTTH